jgi:hypothetical protein
VILARNYCEGGGTEGCAEVGRTFRVQEKTWDLNSYHHFPEKQQYLRTHGFKCIL